MKEYRRRFIRLNMALVGLVLLLALAAIGIYIANNEYESMRRTMSETLEPFRGGNGSFSFTPGGPAARGTRGAITEALQDDGTEPPEKPAGTEPPEKPAGTEPPEKPAGRGDSRLATVFSEDGELTVVSTPEDMDEEELLAAAAEAAEKGDEFGHLKDRGMYYYVTGMADSLRISLYPDSYYTRSVLVSCLYLLIAYILVMGACYFISRHISFLAVRPVERAMEREKRFVADISHDLKTPLAVISSCQRILAENEDMTVKEGRQWLDRSAEAAGNMKQLIDDMLTLSAMDAPGRELKREEVDLSALATKACLQMEAMAYDKGVELSSDIEGGVTVTADGGELMKDVSGLIENALKYEGKGGSARLTLERRGKKAVLMVQNSHSVIDKEDLEHIFERFYRGDKARTANSGHGLGLAIIKSSVEKMGGTISAASDSENGTVFTLTIG